MDFRRFEEVSRPTGQYEKVPDRPLDVVFLGATVTNLAAAVALTANYEGMRLKIYDSGRGFEDGQYILAISPQGWKALTAVSPLATRAITNRKLLINAENLGVESWVDGFPSKTVHITTKKMVDLLISLLPPAFLCFDKMPESVKELPEGVQLTMEDGSREISKLLISGSGAVKGGPNVGNYLKTGYLEVLMKTNVKGGGYMGLPEWSDSSRFAICHNLGQGIQAFTCVVPQTTQNTGKVRERLVDGLEGFCGLQEYLRTADVDEWCCREVRMPPNEVFGHGRMMVAGEMAEGLPSISPNRCEGAFKEAVLLNSSISEKGLTPAALRECERMKQQSQNAKVIGQERSECWMKLWGLSNVSKDQHPLPEQTSCAVSWPGVSSHLQVPVCDITLAKGLRSATPKYGMGWRIISNDDPRPAVP